MTTSTVRPPQGARAHRIEGHGWVIFAAVLLAIIACFNMIYGAAAIAGSNVFVAGAH